MNKRNYQKELDKIIADLDGSVPTLFLHSCCAPCTIFILRRNTKSEWKSFSV